MGSFRHSEKNGSLFSLLSGIFFQLLAGKDLESGFPFLYLYGYVSIFRHASSLSCLEKCLIKQICWVKGCMPCLKGHVSLGCGRVSNLC